MRKQKIKLKPVISRYTIKEQILPHPSQGKRGTKWKVNLDYCRNGLETFLVLGSSFDLSCKAFSSIRYVKKIARIKDNAKYIKKPDMVSPK